ncbi:MAG TPA: glycoside hydrolase family 57 protein, partial [Candidatus Saccharimonadales bacterium]|nr:glycoside hydrolase family 57 protein [Candidatus Saccharimonadales bacterium]
MSKAVVLYLHVHQPYRLRHYTVFDTAQRHDYFDTPLDAKTSNEAILRKVAEKSYLPANARLLKLLEQHPEFKLSLSITGTAIEQMEQWAPEALESFKKLTDTGRVEIVGETYHHSLAFFYSRAEFELQVDMHRRKVQEVFGQTPQVFRNTELAYNNDLAYWADRAGYKAILAEGWDPILDWRSPNFVYRPTYTNQIRLLLKNYRLSDDIAFRFGNRDWAGWPLTADKFAHWMSEDHDATNFNLFMDYETFGEHQWEASGVFDFLEHLPGEWLKTEDHTFMTVSEAADTFDPVDQIDMPETVTWADTERDLT